MIGPFSFGRPGRRPQDINLPEPPPTWGDLQRAAERDHEQYRYGCHGLCAGDGCDACQGVADLITQAKHMPVGAAKERRLGELGVLVGALMTRPNPEGAL